MLKQSDTIPGPLSVSHEKKVKEDVIKEHQSRFSMIKLQSLSSMELKERPVAPQAEKKVRGRRNKSKPDGNKITTKVCQKTKTCSMKSDSPPEKSQKKAEEKHSHVHTGTSNDSHVTGAKTRRIRAKKSIQLVSQNVGKENKK